MKPEFIDIHAHTHFAAYGDETPEVVRRALEQRVWTINVGTQLDTSRAAVELAEQYESGVYAAVGLHPIHTSKSFHDTKELGEGGREFISRGEEFGEENYLEFARHPKTLAIGECGLDYYRLEVDTKARQVDAFERQIDLAVSVGKPVMVHCRPARHSSGAGGDAHRDVIDILTSKKREHGDKLWGDIHFFSAGAETAQKYFDLDFAISFTGVITFTRDYDEAVKYAPLNMIMSETDCPYITPVPHRGTRNEPLYVREVVKRIAEIRGEPFEKVKRALVENALRVFK